MKFFSFLAGAAALLLSAGCAFSEFKTTSAPAEDPRIRFVDNGKFALKPLRVATVIDDEGCLNADVTFELGGSPFLTWLFCGAPMQTLHCRFDWVDGKGAILNGPVRKVNLLPGNILTLGAIAPSEKYTDFRFEITYCGNADGAAEASASCDSAKNSCCKDGKECCKDGKNCCCSGGKACACKECCCKSGKGCCKDGKSACCKEAKSCCKDGKSAKCVKKEEAKKASPAKTTKKEASPAPAKVPTSSASAVKADGKLAESLN